MEVIMDDDGRMNDEWCVCVCVCRSGTGVIEDAAAEKSDETRTTTLVECII